MNLEKAEKIIGYAFKEKALLERAFVHASYANEKGVPSYEKLEFLGDGVLGLIVAEMLYNENDDEGIMTVKRSMIVSTEPLEDATLDSGLDAFIKYGNGESRQNHSDSKVLADVFESLLGAIYLDGGYEEAVKFVKKFLECKIKEVFSADTQVNYKGRLQEYCQARRIGLALYTTTEESRAGKPYFISLVKCGGITASGEGKRKRDAEQNAAKSAFEKLMKS